MAKENVNSASDGKPLPKHIQVAEALRRKILDHTYAPEQGLPSEKELGETYGVSRITIRQALGKLEEEALIQRIRGKGTFVNRNPVRRIPLQISYSESIRRHAPSLKREVLCNQRRPATPVDAALHPGLENWNLLFAERVDCLNGVRVAWDEVRIPAEFSRGLFKRELGRVAFVETWKHQSGVRPAHFQQEVEAVSARKMDTERLKVKAGAPLLKTIEAYLDAKEQLLGLFVSYYHPEYITIHHHSRL